MVGRIGRRRNPTIGRRHLTHRVPAFTTSDDPLVGSVKRDLTYNTLTFNERPLIFPALRRWSACLATLRSTATNA